MHIVYLHQYFVTPDQPGGTRSFEMARRLVSAGHTVDMITTDQTPQPGSSGWRISDEAGIRVHWFSQPYDNRMGWLDRVRAFLSFAVASSLRAASIKHADILFATSTPLTIAIPAIYASTRLRRPYVFEVRDIWPAVPIALGALNNPVLQWLAKRLEHYAYHRAAHVVALAPGMGEEVEKTGYPSDRITIIPNGCDNEIFDRPAATDADGLSGHEEWLGDRPLVLFAGTLGKANNVGYLADIAAAMLTHDPEIRFAIIGNGADRDNIAAHADRLGVLDVNLKLIDAIPKKALAAWVQRATICIALFSGPPILWKDAVQNKFFDALAGGKPVFSNHAGWQCAIAMEYDVGGSMSDTNPTEAAQLLATKARDQDWLEGVAARARKLAMERFSRSLLAEQLEITLTNAFKATGHLEEPAVSGLTPVRRR